MVVTMMKWELSFVVCDSLTTITDEEIKFYRNSESNALEFLENQPVKWSWQAAIILST